MKVPVLLEYNLAEGVVAFSSTRKGGVSEDKFGEFNINTFCGDSEQHTNENKKALAEKLGLDEARIVMPHQVHSIDSRMITEEYFQLPAEARSKMIDGVDALFTNVKNVCVGVSTADCIPVLLYDETNHAVAAIHAGWRGTVKSIVHKVVEEMHNCYGTDPADLKAIIGPGISLEKFEIGDEVYDEFAQAGFDMSLIAKQYEKWHIDLPLCNKIQLEQAGLKSDNIQLSGICTYTHSDEYFSARKLGQASGRIYTGIILK